MLFLIQYEFIYFLFSHLYFFQLNSFFCIFPIYALTFETPNIPIYLSTLHHIMLLEFFGKKIIFHTLSYINWCQTIRTRLFGSSSHTSARICMRTFKQRKLCIQEELNWRCQFCEIDVLSYHAEFKCGNSSSTFRIIEKRYSGNSNQLSS